MTDAANSTGGNYSPQDVCSSFINNFLGTNLQRDLRKERLLWCTWGPKNLYWWWNKESLSQSKPIHSSNI